MQCCGQVRLMRGAEFGWFTTERNPAIGMIAESPGQVDTPVNNMIEYYRSISREEIAAHVAYYTFTSDTQECLRARQDDHLAFRCLQNLLEQCLMSLIRPCSRSLRGKIEESYPVFCVI
jgi:hypothetical protein